MSTKHVQLFNALVRTHHITSRKKVARLKKAAVTHDCYVLLKSGGCPGIMYCEGDEDDVKQWIATVQVRASRKSMKKKAIGTLLINHVQSLRYKDYHLVARPAPVENSSRLIEYGKLFEVTRVKDFNALMTRRGILPWLRKAMGWPSCGVL